MVNTRRRFLKSASSLALGATVAEVGVHASAEPPLYADALQTTSNSLNGVWQFRLDPGKDGEINRWFKPSQTSEGWQNVTVPHTWQGAQDSTGYFGTAWYRRLLEAPSEWRDQTVRIEFEGVFHSASVWLNGSEVGKHLRKGYTAFEFDITHLLLECREASLSTLKPGESTSVPLQFTEKEGATRVELDVVRPHRFLGDDNRVDAMKAPQETRR